MNMLLSFGVDGVVGFPFFFFFVHFNIQQKTKIILKYFLLDNFWFSDKLYKNMKLGDKNNSKQKFFVFCFR